MAPKLSHRTETLLSTRLQRCDFAATPFAVLAVAHCVRPYEVELSRVTKKGHEVDERGMPLAAGYVEQRCPTGSSIGLGKDADSAAVASLPGQPQHR